MRESRWSCGLLTEFYPFNLDLNLAQGNHNELTTLNVPFHDQLSQDCEGINYKSKLTENKRVTFY